jgi:COP9 signalosome complex subunit 3
MDELLPTLLSFPPFPPPQVPLSDAQYDHAIRAQISNIKAIPKDKFLQQTAGGEDILEVGKPVLHWSAVVY